MQALFVESRTACTEQSRNCSVISTKCHPIQKSSFADNLFFLILTFHRQEIACRHRCARSCTGAHVRSPPMHQPSCFVALVAFYRGQFSFNNSSAKFAYLHNAITDTLPLPAIRMPSASVTVHRHMRSVCSRACRAIRVN